MEVFERFMRQVDILNPDVCHEQITIIGAGATGSFTALALAKMGFDNILIYDEDSVEEHNFPNQLFPISHLGNNKAQAVEEIVKEYTEVKICSVPKYYEKQKLKGIVVSALDSMKGRKLIYDNALASGEVKLLIDPRCGAEVFKIYTIDMGLKSEQEVYEKTLHTDGEADPVPCTARAIIYSVLVVSAYVAKQIKLFQMNQPYKREIIMDMVNDMMFTS